MAQWCGGRHCLQRETLCLQRGQIIRDSPGGLRCLLKAFHIYLQHLCYDAGLQLPQRPKTPRRGTTFPIQFNILSGITKNPIFLFIVFGIFVLEILLVTFSGKAFGVYGNFGLTIEQWLICVLILISRSASVPSPSLWASSSSCCPVARPTTCTRTLED